MQSKLWLELSDVNILHYFQPPAVSSHKIFNAVCQVSSNILSDLPLLAQML